MAIEYVCDGCGVPMPDGTQVELGHVIKAQYCATCFAFVENMNAEIDALHTKLAGTWKAGRERIRGKARKNLIARRKGPDARLPDE